jgi:hypothetical protein
MANYEIDPAILIPFLPKGVELDLYEGKAYVSLVGLCLRKLNFSMFRFRIWNLKKSICAFMWFERRNTVKRGVVFINETIHIYCGLDGDKLYKEHYTVSSYEKRNHDRKQSKKCSLNGF